VNPCGSGRRSAPQFEAAGVGCRARWIDIGLVEPRALHAAYAGIAQASPEHARPVVVWGRAPAHLSIGQGQDRGAEIVADPGVPVVRRALGGGAVWVDEHQHCFALILPREHCDAPRPTLMTRALVPLAATLRHFGLEAEQREGDVWVAGRKIAGSGAATLGGCAVIASSFLLRFPAERFAACIALPSPDLRPWLDEGLAAAMTDWEAQGLPPAADALARVFREKLQETFGWQLAADAPTAKERAAMRAWADEEAEGDDWMSSSGRRVAGGVRLNAASHLGEIVEGGRRRRTLVIDGRVVRMQIDGCTDG